MSAVSAAAQAPRELRWAGDPEGGAPYVQASPSDPSKLEGFDVEIADLLARSLGRAPRFVFVSFAQIDQSVARGDADIGLSGIEDTPTRRASMAVTIPYYEFREVLVVREADRATLRTLADLAGRKVGTLGGTIAYEILLGAAAKRTGLQAVAYEDDVHPYTDLALGRVDAVLLDNVIAGRRDLTGLVVQPESVAIGHYVGVLAPGNAPLRDTMNDTLRAAMRDGTLERIFRKWKVWNDDQPALHARLLAGVPVPPVTGSDNRRHRRRGHVALGGDAAIPAVIVPGGRRHAGALVPVDGAGGRARRAHRQRPRLRHRHRPLRVDLVRRADARHADPPAAVRHLLRPRGGDQAAGVRRGARRAGAQLRRV